MNAFLSKYWLTIAGTLLGVLCGYIYYYNWGCVNGCAIKSDLNTMLIYGALMGGLIFNIVEGEIRKYRRRNS